MSNSIEVAKYTFTSWMRKGISANITTEDDLGRETNLSGERAKIPLDITVNSEVVFKKFDLIGPGDILGINPGMIIRSEPRKFISNFEPNYLAFVEFYDEDFIWRYTPAHPQGERLRPWITLLILKEDEFERDNRSFPLPKVTVKTNAALPSNKQLWAWGHAHTNLDFAPGELNKLEDFLRSVNKKFSENPDNLYSRLICPRKLEPNTSYHAFVVPTFESGRLAGLGQPTEGIDAQTPSWNDISSGVDFPIYYSWDFITGENEDFESLVKLLKPATLDEKVGIRDMDCSKPEFGIKTGTKPAILGLEGALKSPIAVSTIFPLLPRDVEDFQKELQVIINLSFTSGDGDPIITPPFYGNKHALVEQLDIDNNGWVFKLNSDPRNRVPSGFGTIVIQNNQENFMRKAWQQVQKVLDANRKIRIAVAIMTVSKFITAKYFAPLKKEKLTAITKPVLSRIKGSATTLHFQLQESFLNTTLAGGAFRRMIRPRGKLIKNIDLNSGSKFKYDELIEDVNSGKISAEPPKSKPPLIPGTDDLINNLPVTKYPGWLLFILRNLNLIFILLLILVVILAVIGQFLLSGIIAIASIGGFIYMKGIRTKLNNEKEVKEIFSGPDETEEIISDTTPPSDFTLDISDSEESEENVFGVKSEPDASIPGIPFSGASAGGQFRTAVVDLSGRLKFSKTEERKLTSFNFENASVKISNAIDPEVSFPKMLMSRIILPLKKSYLEPENIVPAMMYPDIEDPMYEKLRDISSELLIPNLDLIPQNSISLLITNQPFIESYMVGLNYEMGRELLWREYPTDQRGSYFRQFWDVKGIIAIKDDSMTEAQITESYKDIKPIHTWGKTRALGSNNNRDTDGDGKQLVLVIRGELLKRYPNTVIYAQKAIKGRDANNNDPHVKLELTDEELKKEIKFPMFKAEIEPDIKFFGFELTPEQAKGTETTPGFTDNDGWFFIIQEPPGEPRFGMDIEIEQGPNTWDKLSWEHFGDIPLPFINTDRKPSLSPTDDIPGSRWGANSAQMAYVLYQKPVMVAVHGKEMLEGV